MQNEISHIQPNLLNSIPNLDIRHGIAMTGGTETGYFIVLSMFCKDAEDRLPFFKTMPTSDTLTKFVVSVHALKSASSSIGSTEVSTLAGELEAAGKAEDFAVIQDKLPVFVEQLEELVKNIKQAMEKWSLAAQVSSKAESKSIPISLLKDLSTALEYGNGNEISRILQELDDLSNQQTLDSMSKEAIEQISDEVMMAEYENARKIIEKLITDA
jgi:HPt (histidine-containing phosphotransfer) domain-containing protein